MHFEILDLYVIFKLMDLIESASLCLVHYNILGWNHLYVNNKFS